MIFWFRLYGKKVIQIILRKRKTCVLCNIQIIVIVLHSAHGIRFKLVPNWEQSMLNTKSLQVLLRKGIPILKGLKVSSLTCKCAFYRPELNAKVGPHGIEFWNPWNIPMEVKQSLRNIREKWGHLSSYHVYSHTYSL